MMRVCYICEREVMKAERDHFPRPKSLGGTDTQDICRDCHDMKDRHPLEKWDPNAAFEALRGLWNKATASERLLLAKMFHISSQQAAVIRVREAGVQNSRQVKT